MSEEEEQKLESARAIGSPLFLTAQEMDWLRRTMLSIADKARSDYPTNQQKLDYIYSVAIGMKATRSLLENEVEEA